MSIPAGSHALLVLIGLVISSCDLEMPPDESVNSQGDSMFSSPLQRALREGLAPDGDLEVALEPLQDYDIRSRKDAHALVDALSHLPSDAISSSGDSSPLYLLLSLFPDSDSKHTPAYSALEEDGTKQLIRVFDALKTDVTENTASDLLFLLKILAEYETHAGAEKVIEAARMPLKPDDFWWYTILDTFSEEHPEQDFVYRSLADNLPPKFIAVSLLDSANQCALKNQLDQHPFGTDQGASRIYEWLTSSNKDEFSYAFSAVTALPFLKHSRRDELLGLAREHSDSSVRIEAAWASTKLGQEIGLQMLSDFCLDINQSKTAIHYLKELGKLDRIPEEAKNDDFQAKAEFASWLAHPNELGQPPDELEVVDKRTIFWPPAGEKKTLWLIKYRLQDKYELEPDDVDCGLVGSTTWCFFSYKMNQRPPEDCLAIHCCWELDLWDMEIDDPKEHESLLNQWPHDQLTDAVVSHLVEIPAEFGYGREQVVLAKAMMNRESGWAVLDGENSAWYPEDEMPGEQYDAIVLKIHVGRRLLEFNEQPNRRKFIQTDLAEHSAKHSVEQYEKLLKECESTTVERKKELVAEWNSPLNQNLILYSEACAKTGQESRASAFIRAYEILHRIAKTLPAEIADDALGSFGPIGRHFEEYVDLMVDSGREKELLSIVHELQPFWDHNYGYGLLGTAAFKAGDHSTAEKFFTKLKESYPDWRRSEEMSLMARIWVKRGNNEQARDLLIDCLEGLSEEAKAATGSDRNLYEEWYQTHRSTYLELFPNQAYVLQEKRIPNTTLE